MKNIYILTGLILAVILIVGLIILINQKAVTTEKQELFLEVYRVNTEGVKWSDKSKHTLLKSFSSKTEEGNNIITKLKELLDNPHSYEQFLLDWEGFPTYRLTISESGEDTDVYLTPSVNFIVVHKYDGILNRDGYRIANNGSYEALKEEYDQLLFLMGLEQD